MRTITATVYSRSETYDSARVATLVYASAGNVTGVLLPTGGERVQKNYGMEYAGEFEFYSKKRNAALLAGNRLQVGGVYYDIVAVRDYLKVITLLLVRVVA